MTSHTKPKNKKFFSVRTRRLSESFEGLDSSLAQLTGELCSCKISSSMHDFKVQYTCTLAPKVLNVPAPAGHTLPTLCLSKCQSLLCHYKTTEMEIGISFSRT